MSSTPLPDDTAAVSPRQSPRVGLRVHEDFPMLAMGSGVLLQQILDANLAAIPGCSRWFAGVTRYAGQTVPVFDLAHWLGLPAAAGKTRSVVVVEERGRRYGVLATQSPSVLPALQSIEPWPGAEGLRLHVFSSTGRPLAFHPFDWLSAVAPSITRMDALEPAAPEAPPTHNPSPTHLIHDAAFEGNTHVQ